MSRSVVSTLLAVSCLVALCLIKASLAADTEPREWESADGKFKITATLKEYLADDGKVVLTKKDGKEITVPLAKLSKADQELIKKTHGKAEAAKAPEEKKEPKVEAVKKEVVKKDDAENEKLAKEVVEQFKKAFAPVKQPKWEKVWSVNLDIPIKELDVSKEGDYIATVNNEGDCVIRGLKDGNVIKTGDSGFLGKAHKVAISPDGKHVLNASSNGVIIWEIETGKKAFVHEAPKGNIQEINFSRDNERVNILDEERTFHSYPRLGGRGDAISLKDKTSTSATFEKFSTSPDNKKYVSWKNGGLDSERIRIDYLRESKKSCKINFKLSNKTNQFNGGLCSNDYFLELDNTGVLTWASTDLAQDSRPLVHRGRETSFNRLHLRSVNSWDAKNCAFVNDHGILAFPAANPAIWKVFAPPPGRYSIDRFWLLPDFEHVLTIDDDDNLLLWKTSFAEQIVDVPTLRELVEKRNFDALDRAYLIIDEDEELEKYAIVDPWTERFMDIFTDVLKIEQGKENNTIEDDLVNWNKENSDNVIGRMFLAVFARNEAWKARGRGYASTVTEEGGKIFHEKMLQSRELLQPLFKRERVPSEALYSWMEMCQATGWEEDDVTKGITRLLKDHPLHATTHRMIAFSMLPRWHGQPGDSEKYADKVADKVAEIVGEEYKDAIYCSTIKSLYRRRLMNPNEMFDDEKNPVMLFDKVQLDWIRAMRGADQLMKLYPDDPRGATLGLGYSIQASDTESIKKYLKILDEQYSSIPAPYCTLGVADLIFLRQALEKAGAK